MSDSGYNAKVRNDAIRGAFMRQKEMERKVRTEEIPRINRKAQKILRMKVEEGA